MAETPMKIKPTRADLDDIQGLVYSGWGDHEYAGYLFATFGDAARSRAWLASVHDQVSSASTSKTATGDRLNIALSPLGMQKLGLPDGTYAALPQEAKRGMHQRARILGDDDPTGWELGKDNELDVLVMVFARDERRRTDLLAEHRAALVAAGATVRPDELTLHLEGTEHFGFKDGVAQPFLPGKSDTPPPGETVLPAGEILLGYQNAYGKLPASPKWGDLEFGHNGTYLVFRKLHQHVDRFWGYVADRAADLEPDPAAAAVLAQRLAAKLVGRWKSGASLVRSPDRDNPAEAKPEVANLFKYWNEDRFGDACPVSSHVRRANPRDARGDNPSESLEVVNRHRIIRRGRSYGPKLADEHALAGRDDGVPRGLYFFSLQASIARGFEFIQQTWLSNPGFNGLFCEPDPIMGNGDGTGEVTIPCAPLRLRLANVPSVVTVMGGGYFFLPSKTALARLARTA